MKIALSATGPTLDAELEQRFGRCPWFLIVNVEDLGYEALENTSVSLGHGAGIQAAEIVAGKGVKDVITGHCGPKAHQALSSAGVGVLSGCSGRIRRLVEQYKSGALTPATGPDVADHFGGGGRGMGGGGRGMGGGGRGGPAGFR
jgi:predicted Fe-Mo cluster-binding NifX family protein